MEPSSIPVDAVGHLTLGWYDTTFGQHYQNHLRYRAHDPGEYPASAFHLGTEDGENFCNQISQILTTRLTTALREGVELRTLSWKWIHPFESPLWIYTYDSPPPEGDEAEQADAVDVYPDHETPMACACFVKKSYVIGRKGIGKMLFGPISGAYTEQGRIVDNPSGIFNGTPLSDVSDALLDPLTFAIGAGTATLKPCCVGDNELVNISSQHDLRQIVISEFVTYLKSRSQKYRY